MTQPSTPRLPAPLAGAGKTITQRLSDLEAAVNALIARAPTFATAQSVADLKAALDADRKAAEARHQELLRAVAASAQPPVQFPDLSGLQKAVDQHGKDIADLKSRPAPELRPLPAEVEWPDLAPLEGRVQVLEEMLGMAEPSAEGTVQALGVPEGLAAPLDPAAPGYAALIADGRYVTAAAVHSATDAELDEVPGIGPATITALRAFLKEVHHV